MGLVVTMSLEDRLLIGEDTELKLVQVRGKQCRLHVQTHDQKLIKRVCGKEEREAKKAAKRGIQD